MMSAMTMDRMVMGTLITIMLAKVIPNVINELNAWGRLLEIIWRKVSTSLVYADMTLPWACVSKYLMGKDCMCSNMPLRSFSIVPWVTLIISRLCRYEHRAPKASTTPSLNSVTANGP